MSGFARALWLASVLVCLSVQASAQPAFTLEAAPTARTAASGTDLLAQNDLSLSGGILAPEQDATTPSSAAVTAEPVPQPDVQINTAPPVVTFPDKPVTTTRIALLLPLRSASLRLAAEAVLAGFRTGAERDKDERLSVAVIETGDEPADILSAYQNAEAQADVIVGPLTRSGVAAVAQSGNVRKPTLALAQAEYRGDGDMSLPPRMVMMGLSLEEEARQVARDAAASGVQGRAWIISAGAAWQQRVARAFVNQWRELRRTSESMEISAAGSVLNPGGLRQLKKRLQSEEPAFIFAAVDTDQASQLREATGGDTPMMGTSQINPMVSRDWPAAARRPELNGVRLVDMPWLLQPDHPAVMAYQHTPAATQSSPRGVDLERLYALGIDAWRVAREFAFQRNSIELDGVTGQIRIDASADGARFQRIVTPAEYQDGMVMPLAR